MSLPVPYNNEYAKLNRKHQVFQFILCCSSINIECRLIAFHRHGKKDIQLLN